MFEMLEFRIDFTDDLESDCYRGVICVWDGQIYVAGKEYVNRDPLRLFDDLKEFWKYWSNVYLDRPELTPDKEPRDGMIQLKLGI